MRQVEVTRTSSSLCIPVLVFTRGPRDPCHSEGRKNVCPAGRPRGSLGSIPTLARAGRIAQGAVPRFRRTAGGARVPGGARRTTLPSMSFVSSRRPRRRPTSRRSERCAPRTRQNARVPRNTFRGPSWIPRLDGPSPAPPPTVLMVLRRPVDAPARLVHEGRTLARRVSMGRISEGHLCEEFPQDLVRFGPSWRSLSDQEEEVLDGRAVQLEDLEGCHPLPQRVPIGSSLQGTPLLREELVDLHALVPLEERVVGTPDVPKDPESCRRQVSRRRAPCLIFGTRVSRRTRRNHCGHRGSEEGLSAALEVH